MCDVALDSSRTLTFREGSRFDGVSTANGLEGNLGTRHLKLRAPWPGFEPDSSDALYGECEPAGEDVLGWSAVVLHPGDAAIVLYAEHEGWWAPPDAPARLRLKGMEARFVREDRGRRRAISVELRRHPYPSNAESRYFQYETVRRLFSEPVRTRCR